MAFKGFLKQSTAVTVGIGPFVDSTDGDTEETALTINASDIIVSKNGAASAAKNEAGAAAHLADGNYDCDFDATDTGTVGILEAWVHVAGALQVKHSWFVLEEAIYDALFAASAAGFDANQRVDVGAWLGTAVTTSGTTAKPEVDAFSISDDATAANNAELMFDGTGYTGGTAKLDVNVASSDDIDLTATQKTSVNTEADTALSDIGLDHLVSAAVVGADVADNSIIAYLADDAATADWDNYDNTANSLQALRVRGDAAWITGGGGGITDILNVQPIIPPDIDLADTATVRIGIMLTNAVDDLPSTAEITPGTISIHRKAIGGTSWTAVVTDGACSEAAGHIYYDEVFDSGTGYAEGDSIRFTFKSQKITVAANDYEITDATGVMFQTAIRQTMKGTNSAALASVLGTPAGADIATDISNITAGASVADIAAQLEDSGLVMQTGTITISTQTSFTLSAGSADDDAYNNCYIIIEDVSTAAQKCVGVIKDYTGSTKTVTLEGDPGIFTMASTDKFAIIPRCSPWDRVLADHTTAGTTGAALDTAGGSGVNQYLVWGALVQESDGDIYWLAGCLKNGQPQDSTACTIKLYLIDGDGTVTDTGATETVTADDAQNVISGKLATVSVQAGRQYYMNVSLTADAGTRKGNIPVAVPVRTS